MKVRILLTLVLSLLCSSLSFQTKLLARQIQAQPTNVTHALYVLSQVSSRDSNDDEPFVAALRVCGRVQRPDVALEVYKLNPSEACRITAISVLGSCHALDPALELLSDTSFGDASVASYNAAIAACGKVKDWRLSLDIYEKRMPKELISPLTCNAVLSILSKCRQGEEALRVLSNMPCTPNRLNYQNTVNALVRSDLVDMAYELISVMKQNKESSIQPFEVLYDMVIAGYSKRSKWEAIDRVETMRNPNWTSNTSTQDLYSFQHWEGLRKVGTRKEAHWEVATYNMQELNITIGVQPNRNPAKNGIRLLFYENYWDGERWEQRKLGFLLMNNSNNQSSLLGMFLKGKRRRQGVAKVCLAIWLWFCLKAAITPTTGVINKPLLSLLLQYRFGFVPHTGGVEAELFPADESGAMCLYGRAGKSLRGALSPWDIQNQNIHLLQTRPSTPGRKINIRCGFASPDAFQLREFVKEILPDASIECNMSSEEVKLLYLGK